MSASRIETVIRYSLKNCNQLYLGSGMEPEFEAGAFQTFDAHARNYSLNEISSISSNIKNGCICTNHVQQIRG